MVAIASLLIVLVVSLLIIRVATVALTLTGLPREVARFQARSAFTGVGFTTSESEETVNHPVRRRILMLLMLLGNAGIVTVITSLMITFVTTQQESNFLPQILMLLTGLIGLLVAANSTWVDRRLSPIIGWALRRWAHLDVRDYANLLQLYGEFGVMEVQVKPGDWMAEKTLGELSLSEEGALVLGIHRAQGDYTAVPRGPTVIHAGDTLILYGKTTWLAELDRRRTGRLGDQAHEQAVKKRRHLIRNQK